jgi:hypothetical protein
MSKGEIAGGENQTQVDWGLDLNNASFIPFLAFWLSGFFSMLQIELHRPIHKIAELAAFLPRPGAEHGG